VERQTKTKPGNSVNPVPARPRKRNHHSNRPDETKKANAYHLRPSTTKQPVDNIARRKKGKGGCKRLRRENRGHLQSPSGSSSLRFFTYKRNCREENDGKWQVQRHDRCRSYGQAPRHAGVLIRRERERVGCRLSDAQSGMRLLKTATSTTGRGKGYWMTVDRTIQIAEFSLYRFGLDTRMECPTFMQAIRGRKGRNWVYIGSDSSVSQKVMGKGVGFLVITCSIQQGVWGGGETKGKIAKPKNTKRSFIELSELSQWAGASLKFPKRGVSER